MPERNHQPLTDAEVQDMRVLEPSCRNRLLLRLLYSTGLSASDLCGLSWGDVEESDGAGPLIIIGRGGRLRFVPLPTPIWEELQAFRGRAGPREFVFQSRRGDPLSVRQVDRIVRSAARSLQVYCAGSAIGVALEADA